MDKEAVTRSYLAEKTDQLPSYQESTLYSPSRYRGSSRLRYSKYGTTCCSPEGTTSFTRGDDTMSPPSLAGTTNVISVRHYLDDKDVRV